MAQKKAFFEAHYKKIAAQKAEAEAEAAAAALLEQEKAKSQVEERVGVINHGAHDSEATVLLKPRDILTEISNLHASQKMVLHSKQQPAVLNLKISVDEEQHIASKAIDAAGHSSCVNIVEPETEKIVIAADLKNKELFDNKENFEDQVSVSEDSRSSQMDRPLLKVILPFYNSFPSSNPYYVVKFRFTTITLAKQVEYIYMFKKTVFY